MYEASIPEFSFRKTGVCNVITKKIFAKYVLNLDLRPQMRTTGASSKTLCRHLDSPPFDEHFNFCRVVGQLSYLEKCSRLDISCAVHQAARFVSNPRIQHGKALKWLGRYPVGSRDKAMIYSPSNQSFDVFVDASFTGD
jgi:hypothetical protein